MKTTSLSMGSALVALSALGYGTNPIFGKIAYQSGANAITLGMIRFSLASIALWLVLAARGQGKGVPLARRLQLVAMGGLGMGMVALLYFTALEHINASLATGLFYTYPAMVTLAGVLRGQAMNRNGYAGLALTAAGTWLLLGTDLGGFTWQGALLILAAAVLYSGYVILSEPWTRGVAPTVATAHVVVGAALVYILLALATGQHLPGVGAYFAGAGLAICSTILALSTFFAGVPLVGPMRASIISTLEPVFTALLAVVFLNERLTLLQTLGVGVVVLGAVAAQLRDRPAMTSEQA